MTRAQRVIRPATAFSLSSSKRKRPRQEEGQHLKWIRTLPCLVTGRHDGIEAAHIRYDDVTFGKREVGLGEKPDDRWTIPLQKDQHRDQHSGNEKQWWGDIGIDPIPVAMALWGVTGDTEAAEVILREARAKRKPHP